MHLSRKWRFALASTVGLGLLSIGGSVLAACSPTGTPAATTAGSAASSSAQNGTLFTVSQNRDVTGPNANATSYSTNAHNNVNFSDLAAALNVNITKWKYQTLNNPAFANFLKFMSTKKVLLVDAAIPNPKWPHILPTDPGSQLASQVQNNFVLLTPNFFNFFYSSPQNKALPGFGAQFPWPTDQTKLAQATSWVKGSIIASKPGQQTSGDVFSAFAGTADLVIYLYPDTSTWVPQRQADVRKALSPLLTPEGQKNTDASVIVMGLDRGYQGVKTPIGQMYLFQSYFNGQAYQQSQDGTWSLKATNDVPYSSSIQNATQYNPWKNNNLWNYYVESTKSGPDASLAPTADQTAAAMAIKPYMTLTTQDLFGLNLYQYGYTDDKDGTVTFPFAGKFLKTITVPQALNKGGNQNTLSLFFDALGGLISLGFTPNYAVYLIDPNAVADQSYQNKFLPELSKGIVAPDYVQDFYPNLEAAKKAGTDGSSVSDFTPADGRIIPVSQELIGVWHHHNEPKPQTFTSLNIGVAFAAGWSMQSVSAIYNNGNPLVSQFIYLAEGDVSPANSLYYTADNQLAARDTQTPQQFNTTATYDGKQYSISVNENDYNGLLPKDYLNKVFDQKTGQTLFQHFYSHPDSEFPGVTGNGLFEQVSNFQWFANQLTAIKNNEFQLGVSMPVYFGMFKNSTVLPNLLQSKDNLAYYAWNVGPALKNFNPQATSIVN